MTQQETAEKLAALRGQLDTMAAEVGEIVNTTPPRVACRVSYIVDRLKLVREEIDAAEQLAQGIAAIYWEQMADPSTDR